MSGRTTEQPGFPSHIDYEWICHYEDGTKLYQNHNSGEDEHNFGHIQQDKLGVFELTNGQNSIKVDLQTGKFNINGQEIGFDLGFKLHEDKQSAYHLDPEKYELIYFCRVRRDFAPEGMIETVKYFVGWKTNIDGVVYQRLALVDEDTGSIDFVNNRMATENPS